MPDLFLPYFRVPVRMMQTVGSGSSFANTYRPASAGQVLPSDLLRHNPHLVTYWNPTPGTPWGRTSHSQELLGVGG